MDNKRREKYQRAVQEQKDIPRYGNLRGHMLAYCSPEWYAAACEYFERTKDINGFEVMLKGA